MLQKLAILAGAQGYNRQTALVFACMEGWEPFLCNRRPTSYYNYLRLPVQEKKQVYKYNFKHKVSRKKDKYEEGEEGRGWLRP